MRAIRSKDSKIELRLRSALWAKGYRYRVNVSDIFGKPDIVFTKYRIVIFVDSEFWHGFDWEQRRNEIQSNKEFWTKKIESNIARDRTVNMELRKMGWIVLRFWGREITENLDRCIKDIERQLKYLRAPVIS